MSSRYGWFVADSVCNADIIGWEEELRPESDHFAWSGFKDVDDIFQQQRIKKPDITGDVGLWN
jgi:hypothetical protein